MRNMTEFTGAQQLQSSAHHSKITQLQSTHARWQPATGGQESPLCERRAEGLLPRSRSLGLRTQSRLFQAPLSGAEHDGPWHVHVLQDLRHSVKNEGPPGCVTEYLNVCQCPSRLAVKAPLSVCAD